ncbi:PDxFFG protein [Mycoplasma sp. Z463D]
MIKDWSLKKKVLLSLAILSAGAGVAIGSMVAYAENSDEKLGPTSPANKMLFNNDYAKIYDAEGNLKPELAILDPQKKTKVANISEDASQYSFVDAPEKKYSFTDFFNAYFEKYNEAFVLEVKYGSFSFYNEYVLAVHPEQFIEFSNWFIKNVAWGPDLLTLDSFRIVPGVEQNGNAITLGSHSTLHKEVSEIKFFPDAFFGSLPIYSSLGGRGNAPDALTYQTFSSEVSKDVLDEYLKNIPYASAVKNQQLTDSYKEILNTSKLNGEKFKVLFDNSSSELKFPLRDQTLYLPFDVTEEQFAELKNKYADELANAEFSQLQDVEIVEAKLQTAIDKNSDVPTTNEDKPLSITFKYLNAPKMDLVQTRAEIKKLNETLNSLKKQLGMPNAKSTKADSEAVTDTEDSLLEELNELFIKFKDVLAKADSTRKDLNSHIESSLTKEEVTTIIKTTLASLKNIEKLSNKYTTIVNSSLFQGRSFESYKLFKQVANSKIKSFLDFYDIDSYVSKHDTLYVYKPNNGDEMQFFPSFLEAINNLPQLGDNYVKQSSLVQKYFIKETNITNIPQYNLHSLEVTLENAETGKKLYLDFSASKANNFKPEGFDQFKDAIGYLGSIDPVTLFYTPEDKTLQDANGQQIKGLAARKYQVYTEAYNGLLDKITAKYPHLLRKLSGPHIVKSVNDNGVYEYKLQDGDYRGLTPGDRIGLPLVLGALIPGFKGVPTDFLKYVATHEYGHHYTLDQGQAWINDKNPIIVGGLSTRGGANESSYYSYEALVNYLEARTNIEVIRVNANNQPTENGKFIRFRFGIIDENGHVVKIDGKPKYETEALADIWGTNKSSDDIYNILKNTKRRFLQDFAGMVKAAKERGVALGDLFIANSFDADSGTLNPEISGIGKVFKKLQDASGNYDYKLVPISARDIISQMKDGSGKPLSDIVTFIDDDHFNVKIYELDEKNPKIVRKINMFKKDGKPVIQVPLGVELDEESLTYLRGQAKVIEDSIAATIRKNMYDSGWNTSGTRIGGKIDFFLTAIFEESTDLSSILKGLEARGNETEIDPRYNAYIIRNWEDGAKKREANTYFVINNLGAHNEVTSIARYYNNFINGKLSHSAALVARDGLIDPVVTFKNDGDTALTANKFILPFMDGNYVLSTLTNFRDPFANNISNLASRYDGNDTKARWSKNFAFTFLEATGIAPYRYVQVPNTGNLKGEYDTFLGYFDSNGSIVNSNEVLDRAFQLKRSDFDDKIRGITINPFSTHVTENDRLLLSAVNPGTNKVNVINIFNADNTQTKPSIRAKNVFDLLTFGSMDYSKAKYDAETGTYNWDIDYVQSKFDLNVMNEIAKKDTDSKTSDLRKEITNAPELSQAKNQALANYAMYRFRHSNLVLSVVDFSPATQLVENRAVFSKLYGVPVLNDTFNKYYAEDATKSTETKELVFDVAKLQDFINSMLKDQNLGDSAKYLSFNDFLSLVGNNLLWKNHGIFTNPNDASLFNLNWGGFSSGEPSSDVKNYNDTRVEPLLNDKFTDYIYSIAETLTRDYVQTVYSPNTNDFGNTPDYLSGLSEAITGLDYVVDGTKLNSLRDKLNNAQDIAKGLKAAIEASKYDQYYKDNVSFEIRINKEIAEAKRLMEEAKAVLEAIDPSEPEWKIYKEFLEAKQNRYIALTSEKINTIVASKAKYFGEISGKKFYSTDSFINSNYFGKFISNSNGFFKDRFEKETIKMELYDTERNPIVDENIRLKDFEGNRITNRPEAFFISQLLNYGVSKRTISGLFRNKELDALAMYGYIPLDLAQRAKYIKFTDVDTKEEKFLKINTNKTNNIFWLQKQGDVTTKKTIEDYGYTSWLSDYTLMAKYRDALLKPKHRYYVEFADEKQVAIQPVTLGNVDAISENAKAAQQSPIKIIPEVKSVTKDGQEVLEPTGKTIISVDFQFNISH